MEFNSSDYFSYKKNKLQTRTKEEKPLSKLSFLFQLFIATFVVIFIIIVVAIMKYSAKVDIEYSQGEIAQYNTDSPEENTNQNIYDDERGKIDKRLTFIQQEENAPSEAKIIEKKETHTEVIDPKHIENSKKIEKIEKIKEQNAQSENSKLLQTINETSIFGKKPVQEPQKIQKNITITSKVLIGRYASFEEAQKMQTEIKESEPNLSPYVRKTGDVFSVQMGSYQDFSTAKTQAQVLKAKGFDVWIYQQ